MSAFLTRLWLILRSRLRSRVRLDAENPGASTAGVCGELLIFKQNQQFATHSWHGVLAELAPPMFIRDGA